MTELAKEMRNRENGKFDFNEVQAWKNEYRDMSQSEKEQFVMDYCGDDLGFTEEQAVKNLKKSGRTVASNLFPADTDNGRYMVSRKHKVVLD